MVSKHGKYPIGMAEKANRAKRAATSLKQRLAAYASAFPTQFPKNEQYRGLPYNTVVSDDFRSLLQLATGSATALALRTYWGFLDADFDRFCFLTEQVLMDELKAAYFFPFLNVLHDNCTASGGKKGLVGSSISFISKNWEFTNIALLVTVHNGLHASVKVKALITSRTEELYRVDIESMAQFTMSDTTPSAQKVLKLFEDSLPTDCTVRVLNLCLLYGIGVRENCKTVSMLDPATGKQKIERRLCTVGGPFPEDAALIKKVRNLNNYFNSPQWVGCLSKRTIVNYPVFKAYFQHCEPYDDSEVFDKLVYADWRLTIEMESITLSSADLVLIDVQRSSQLSPELIVLTKFTLDRLATNTYQIYDLDAAKSPQTNEHSLPRHAAHISTLSSNAQICVSRIKGQVAKRLPTLAPESVIILLLDLRTKFTVDTLVQPASFEDTTIAGEGDGGVNDGTDAVVSEGKAMLCNVHREAFRAIHSASSSSKLGPDVDAQPNLDLVPSTDDISVICGASVTASTASTAPVGGLHDQVDEVLRKNGTSTT
ncbi:hypothetical protein F442_12006 [Phytophthora nicotianae P10297]|uniref:Uncharacterized protein n=1 Tax=Phytophthora nicotianae P10297 TaxID=1317064 RepID=W2Z198_PHYNI|nr:hypothetical protein F442_12006 [Phytophthora nicotianae P10297]